MTQRVVVKTLTGQARILWTVSLSERLIYVTDKRGYLRIKAGRTPDREIGIPLADVFEYPADHSINDGDKPNWGKLKQFVGGPETN